MYKGRGNGIGDRASGAAIAVMQITERRKRVCLRVDTGSGESVGRDERDGLVVTRERHEKEGASRSICAERTLSHAR